MGTVETKYQPFSEQEGAIKRHRIALSIDCLNVPLSQDRSCPHCKSPLRDARIEHIFGWGDTERLECVVQDTPALQCECHTSLQAQVVWPIKEKARAIREYFEFRKQDDLDTITAFLSPDDVSKVRDFADALRKEPFFIPEGTFAGEGSTGDSPSFLPASRHPE